MTTTCRRVFGAMGIIMLLSSFSIIYVIMEPLHSLSYRPFAVGERGMDQLEAVEENNGVLVGAWRTWTQLKQGFWFMDSTDVTPITTVLLLAYMRGGSSFLMELFNQDPRSVTWFEPLQSFYSSHFGLPYSGFPLTILYHSNLTRRIPDHFEQTRLNQFVDTLLSIDLAHLPVQTLAHRRFIKQPGPFQHIFRCLPKIRQLTLQNCTDLLQGICVTDDPRRNNMTLTIINRCDKIIEALRIVMHSNTTATNSWASYFNGSDLVMDSDEFERTRNAVELLVGERVNHLDSFIRYHLCLGELDGLVRPCWSSSYVQKLQKKATIIAAKLLRWSLADIEPLIQRRPAMRMIHFVRDPRATAASRTVSAMRFHWSSNDNSTAAEAKALCVKMRNDFADKISMTSKYPGRILTIRYEDFVTRPIKTIGEIYQFIGRTIPDGIEEWVEASLHGKADTGYFGEVRVNGTAMIDKWRKKVGHAETQLMNKYCADILKQNNYDP